MSQRPAAQAASPLARFGAGIARLWPVGRRAREAKASKAGPLIALETPRGEPVWTPRDYASFAREGVMSNAIVYRSVRMIAEAAASVPLLLYEGRAEIEEHPLLDLLQRPSPGQTGTDLLESFYGFLLVAGNAYLEAARVGGELRELHVLRPDRMKVVPGADGWPEAFEYTAGGASVRIAAEPVEGVRPVLHMKLFHPANDHYGLSPIEAAATAIDLHNAAAKWNKALLDNSARPSGALVYTSGAQMTGEQFERLKAELEVSFQGARNAGRPLLLEGGLDWKTMSLSPRDLDFMEARHAAAREIALAIGVPPMLLGIPGDNTYANYAEANRAFWRQTVLPLVNRMARALGGWLAPAWGGDLRLAPDLDQIEALTPEREALWARIGAASFLSDDEKRAAVGYGDAEEGGDRASCPFARKYREDQARDDRGRWVEEGGGEDEEGEPESGEHEPPREPDEFDEEEGQDPLLHRVSRRGPGQSGNPRLDAAFHDARQAVRQTRELDPNWQAPRSFTSRDNIEGQIAHYEAVARAAQARLAEVLPRGFGSYENYAQFGPTLRQGFAGAGYTDTVPMIRGSSVTGESFRTGRPFDSNPVRRSDFDLAISSPSALRRAEELGIGLRESGSRTGPLRVEQLEALGLTAVHRELQTQAGGRDISIMIYSSPTAITRRGPSRPFPAK